MGNNLDMVHTVPQLVRNGKVHAGQEVLVSAFARHGDTLQRKACSVVPTRKQGSFPDSALIIGML